tara:strand:+ start:411 stop:569 length:159 start_codon:yes stop_codon:yes gene_type:complete
MKELSDNWTEHQKWEVYADEAIDRLIDEMIENKLRDPKDPDAELAYTVLLDT